MKKEELEGLWHQVSGVVRELWGEVRGDERQFSSGQKEVILGRLQQKYDMTREEAEKALEDFSRRP